MYIVAFKLSNKLVDDFLLDMLHHYHMGEVAAEAYVIAVGKIVFRHYLVVGTLKKHRVAVFVIPARLPFGIDSKTWLMVIISTIQV